MRLLAGIALSGCALLIALAPVLASGSSPYSVGWTARRTGTGSVLIGVRRAGTELFGLGSEPARSPAGTDRMLMWRSTNGTTWTPVPLSPRVFPPGSRIGTIVRLGARYVAVGGIEAQGRNASLQAMVWMSPDAHSWSRVPDQPAFHGAMMTAAAVGRNTIVAVGSVSTIGRRPVTRESGAAWISRNGIAWRRVPGQAFAGASIAAVIRAGSRFVAVGDSYPAPPPYGSHAVVWVSADGSAWIRVPRNPAVFVNASAMSRVVAGPTGPVAYGFTEPPSLDYRSLLWTSPDGLHWHFVTGDPLKHGFVNGMTSAGKSYIAVGSADGDPALWSSPDAAHWRQVADGTVFTGANTQLFDITALPGHLLIAGADVAGPSSSRIPTVWLWTAGSTVRPRPVPAAKNDPRHFRLRYTDLPPGYSAGLDSRSLICDLEDRPDPGGRCHHMLDLLGNYSAYFTEFDRIDGRGDITGTSIIISFASGAREVLQDPSVLIQPLGEPPPHRIATGVRIGQELRLYEVRVPKRSYSQGESPYWNGVAGVWRDGRAIGIVEVTFSGKGAESLVVRLARAMHARV